MINLSTGGSGFKNTVKWLQSIDPHYIYNRLDKYGQLGVERLREATPKDTGLTANSWTYHVHVGDDSAVIYWDNTNRKDGVPVALMIQYGHGMPHGGYVQGIDYINPALAPIFEAIKDSLWKEVTKR